MMTKQIVDLTPSTSFLAIFCPLWLRADKRALSLTIISPHVFAGWADWLTAEATILFNIWIRASPVSSKFLAIFWPDIPASIALVRSHPFTESTALPAAFGITFAIGFGVFWTSVPPVKTWCLGSLSRRCAISRPWNPFTGNSVHMPPNATSVGTSL